jgi:F-type H+-transporting ATPase subunit epsilon
MSQNLPSALKLRVITPRRLLVDEDVEMVSLPSLEGYVGILPGHRPLMLALGRGEISFSQAQKQEAFAVQGGYAEIHPERILVFTQIKEDEGSDSY